MATQPPTTLEDQTTPVDPNANTGLINAQANLPAPAATSTVNNATAASMEVKPNQTVQSQVKDIIADNSPLMQQAETRALQRANQRGLLNSSMAVGAGQSAVLDAATPIATSDANIYANAANTNAGLQQQTNLANQNAANTASQFNASEVNKLTQLDQQQKGDLERIAKQGQVQQQLAEFSAGAAKELANIESTYKGLTQASSSAASIMNTTVAAISRIMEDTSLDAAAKQKAIDIYNTNARTSLNIIGSLAGDVDIGRFMDQVLAA